MSASRHGAPRRRVAIAKHAVASATIVTLLAGRAAAAETVWSGSIRVRSEGFDKSLHGQTAQWDFLQRTRLGVAVTVAPDARVFVQMQDARAWGLGASTLANTRNLDVHQAYGELTHAFGATSLRVRAGRQELNCGDERILGPAGWDNVGRAFDALQVRLGRGRLTSDLVAARLADTSEGAPSNDDLLLCYNRVVNATNDRGLEFYGMYRATPAFGSAPAVTDAFETTLGERLFGSQGRLRLEEEFAYQFGSRGRQDLGAFLFTGQVYVRLEGGFAAGAGCDILSGDDPADATFQLFDVKRIFHTGHKFYGMMDVAEGLAGRAGLLDPYAVLQTPGPHGGKGHVDAHFFRVMQSDQPQNPLRVPSGAGEAALGTEIDAEMSVPVLTSTRLDMGAAVLFAGQRLDQDQNAYWGYLQGVLTF